MTQTVHIPDSIEKAIAALDGIGQLLKAKEWERAAIVYAFTRDGLRGPGANTETSKTRSLSTIEFTNLGITGLRSVDTVISYRQAWKKAIERGEASEIQPGQIVTLPSSDNWPGSPEVAESMSRKSQLRRDLEGGSSTPETRARVARQLLNEPEVREQLEDDIVELAAESPRITARVLTSSAERRPTPPQPIPPHRDMAAYGVGTSAIAHARRAYEDVSEILETVTGSGSVDLTARELVQKTITDLHAVGEIYHRYANLLAHAIGEGPEPETTNEDATWIDQIERELSRMGRG